MTGRSDTVAPVDDAVALDNARAEFRDRLVGAGLLVPTVVEGLFGRSAEFEQVVELVRDAVSRQVAEPARQVSFPPVFPREDFERTDYIVSFPQLAGSVDTFTGTNREHAELLGARAAGEPWEHMLRPAPTCLTSAVCHPVYATLPRSLDADGELLDLTGYCYRNEPSVDPMRMVAFRMREFVRVGTPDQVAEHRERWIERTGQVLRGLGLEVEAVGANDPFFGRGGRMLAANQREAGLKTEFVTHVYGGLGEPTAIASCNNHLDHFGGPFSIRTADGEVANSGCVGFGLERIALALLSTHGLDTTSWLGELRSRTT